MAKNSFSIKESLNFGWNTFKKNWQFLVQVFIIVTLLSIVPSYLHDWSVQNLPSVSFIFSILGWVAQMVTGIGVIVICLKFVDHKKAKFSDIYQHYNFLLSYFLGSLLYGLIIVAGLILLVIPGIYFAIKYQFFSYFIVDNKMGPWEAIKASGKITDGVKWKLVLLGIIFAGIMILGVLIFGVGVLIAWPVVSLAGAFVYRKLSA